MSVVSLFPRRCRGDNFYANLFFGADLKMIGVLIRSLFPEKSRSKPLTLVFGGSLKHFEFPKRTSKFIPMIPYLYIYLSSYDYFFEGKILSTCQMQVLGFFMI
jgi:hypothetical protein